MKSHLFSFFIRNHFLMVMVIFMIFKLILFTRVFMLYWLSTFKSQNDKINIVKNDFVHLGWKINRLYISLQVEKVRNPSNLIYCFSVIAWELKYHPVIFRRQAIVWTIFVCNEDHLRGRKFLRGYWVEK